MEKGGCSIAFWVITRRHSGTRRYFSIILRVFSSLLVTYLQTQLQATKRGSRICGAGPTYGLRSVWNTATTIKRTEQFSLHKEEETVFSLNCFPFFYLNNICAYSSILSICLIGPTPPLKGKCFSCLILS